MKKLSILLFLLSACGFTPMYSNNSELQNEISDIYIAPIAGTNGIDLRNLLILSWNTPNTEGAKYKLNVHLNNPTTIYKARQRTGDATWEEIRMTASWTLYDRDKVIMKSSESASESYAFVSDLVATDAAKTTATKNTIKSIGEKIELKVNAKLKNK